MLWPLLRSANSPRGTKRRKTETHLNRPPRPLTGRSPALLLKERDAPEAFSIPRVTLEALVAPDLINAFFCLFPFAGRPPSHCGGVITFALSPSHVTPRHPTRQRPDTLSRLKRRLPNNCGARQVPGELLPRARGQPLPVTRRGATGHRASICC
jgi:hypothetical protein